MVRSGTLKKYVKIIFLVILGLAVIIQAAALVKCEILTRRYYSDFEYAYKNNTMLEDEEYDFKVLDCDGANARVYYVSKGKTGAHVLTFKKRNDDWVETKWETIWSTSGSASEVIWPYWWHFIYGGF